MCRGTLLGGYILLVIVVVIGSADRQILSFTTHGYAAPIAATQHAEQKHFLLFPRARTFWDPATMVFVIVGDEAKDLR